MKIDLDRHQILYYLEGCARTSYFRSIGQRCRHDMIKLYDAMPQDVRERLSVYRSFPSNVPLHYLAKSIKTMAFCKAVYFCKGWENARGCIVEYEAAKRYGLTILYES